MVEVQSKKSLITIHIDLKMMTPEKSGKFLYLLWKKQNTFFRKYGKRLHIEIKFMESFEGAQIGYS